MRATATALASMALMIAATGCTRVTDTGYIGTWSRGNEFNTSTIVIAQRGEEYVFRWAVRSQDGTWSVDCNTWNGPCDEVVNGEKVAEHAFRTWVDEESGNLRLEVTSRRLLPEPAEARTLDELVLNSDGLSLISYTLERDDQLFEDGRRPRRRLEKVSDRADDPPGSAGS